MRILGLIAALSVPLAACGERRDATPAAEAAHQGRAPAAGVRAPPATPGGETAASRWDLRSSGDGVVLALLAAPERTVLRLFCPAGGKTLLVNVPGFRPIGSEERLSFGSGGEVEALVADSRGDRQRGGVSGRGAVPGALETLIRGPVSVSYGAQGSGPHPAPPAALARAFVDACEGPSSPAPATAGPCLVQDGKAIEAAPLRAVGTEPFWGARIQGRCVTYSNPDDQKGSRIWTRFTPGPGGGTWSGALGGRRFELSIRTRPNCSDGMSDRRYPLAAELLLGGERRTGCAEPL